MIKNINIEMLPEVFRVEEMLKLSGRSLTRRRLTYAISRLLEDKKLIKVINGVYSKTGNVFYIAYKLYGGYIGFASALYLHGLKTEVEPTVYLCTASHHAKAVKILGSVIETVDMREMQYGTTLIDVMGRQVRVSTYAKTLFDMLDKPRYANYFDMYRAINMRPLKKEEWKELFYYSRNSSITTIRRIGYSMDGIAPSWFTKALHDISLRGYRTSFFFKHVAENYSGKWNLFDDLGTIRWRNAV